MITICQMTAEEFLCNLCITSIFTFQNMYIGRVLGILICNILQTKKKKNLLKHMRHLYSWNPKHILVDSTLYAVHHLPSQPRNFTAYVKQT